MAGVSMEIKAENPLKINTNFHMIQQYYLIHLSKLYEDTRLRGNL